jgi:Uma2 family endonuclease
MATLAANPLVSVEEYLRTFYRPDCDYVDGVIEERNLGEAEHGVLQGELGFLFRLHRKEWGIIPIPECRLQVGPRRFRIPDVLVLRDTQKAQGIIREAPLLCIEVLSPEDRWARMSVRLDDYVALGVEHIWCFDSVSREVRRYTAKGYEHVYEPVLAIPGTPIQINIADVFSALD